MNKISIDIETYSSVDLIRSGVYKYVQSSDFSILLFAYSVDNGEVKVVDLAKGEQIPFYIMNALEDYNVEKWAFNAVFERICLSKYLGKNLSPKSWRCTMVWCATLGLPLSLDSVGRILNLKKQKLEEGRDLIRYFCVPNKNNNRNLPWDNMQKWEIFKEYNKRDVQVEMEIEQKLRKFPLSQKEWENYYIDQLINDRGIMIDEDFVKSAFYCDEEYKKKIRKRMEDLTHIENVNSTYQIIDWLYSRGIYVNSLDKKAVDKLLNNKSLRQEVVVEVLNLRKELNKISVKKYAVMVNVIGSDSRARGLIQFYGASRTGRFAGRLVQVHNLPKNKIVDLDVARSLVKSRNKEAFEILYDNVEDVLSQLLRTAFIPKEGHKFVVADFSAIEARILSYLSGEKWRMDVFEKGGDIYCESASKIFKVNVVKNKENHHLREKGKLAELSLGYGGGVGALNAVKTHDMTVDELYYMVKSWRSASPYIVKLWWDIDKAVRKVIETKSPAMVYTNLYKLIVFIENNMLFIKLPSGRNLCYQNPAIKPNQFNRVVITYEGLDKNKNWETIESYGPKFVENIVQGIARDLLCYAMKNLTKSNFNIVLHVHDEVVIEVEEDKECMEEICEIMTKCPPWANRLNLKVESYECDFYMKK